MFVFRAAGFIATSVSTSSPGVKTSLLEKCNWKPLTPANDPAGARISAGKSGNVLTSLPNTAETLVICEPANCIPSPLSPQKRITMVSRSSVRFSLAGATSVAAICGDLLVVRTQPAAGCGRTVCQGE